MKKIAILGICGNMGRAISTELSKDDRFDVVAGFDRLETGNDIGSFLGLGKTGKKIYDTYEGIIKAKAELLLDFTGPGIVYKNILWALKASIDIIVGATGLGGDELKDIEEKAKKSKSKVLIVPNFSIGAILMIKASKLLSKYFDDCEIIELHHEKKKDAPSGTSVATIEAITASKSYDRSRLTSKGEEKIEGSRGGFHKGIHVHSVRLPGLLAHQQVIFGTKGQTLTLKHDSIDRLSFYPGVLMAIENIDGLGSFTYGLDSMIDL